MLLIIIKAMRKTFIAVAVIATTSAFNVEIGSEIAAGIIYGVTQGENVVDLTECMQDADKFV